MEFLDLLHTNLIKHLLSYHCYGFSWCQSSGVLLGKFRIADGDLSMRADRIRSGCNTFVNFSVFRPLTELKLIRLLIVIIVISSSSADG